MNIKSIEDRIIEKADMDLREQIKNASEPLDSLLRNGSNHRVTVLADDGQKVAVKWYLCLGALQDAAFEIGKEIKRESAIQSFMEKINGFSEDYATVRQIIDEANEPTEERA